MKAARRLAWLVVALCLLGMGCHARDKSAAVQDTGLAAERTRAWAISGTSVAEAALKAVPTSTPTPIPSPRVALSYPMDGDQQVVPGRPLIIEFDRPMDQASVNARLVISPAVQGRITWPAPNRLAFSPDQPWSLTTYEVALAPGALSAQGVPMREAWRLRFGCRGRGVPVPVLTYHHVAPLSPQAGKVLRMNAVSPEAFSAQMAYLAEQGWVTISPTQLGAYLARGEPLPPKPIIVSMDDGYEDVYTAAYPVFRRTGLRPVLFVVTQYLGHKPYLTWEQLQELVLAGFAVGSHGINHANLRKAKDAELLRQIRDSKAVLEKRLSITIDAFCYPYALYDKRAVAVLSDQKYTTAFVVDGSIYQSPQYPYQMSRVLITYDTTLAEFAKLLQGR